MFKQAKKVVVENSISKVIVSGNPFCQFWFGYKLHRQPNVKWIADYRDDWTTSSLTPKLSFLQRVLLYLQQKKEKEWVGTANYITSISELYVKKVSALVGRPGFVLLNGYEVSSDLDLNVLNQSKRFIITYSGTLYPTQPIEPIIKIICRLINEGYHELFVRFPGISYDEIQKNRVKSIVDSQGMNQNFELTNRVSREKVIDMQLQSDLLLMISHENIKGIPSSKLYEYIALERTILLYPGDNDIIDATLKDVGLGIICDTEEQLYNTIKSKLEEKRKLGVLPKPSFNTKGKQLYSRRNQVEVLSKILNKL